MSDATLPADLHMHSKYCGHARGELAEYVERGIELGLPAVGFSFHLPVRIPADYKVNVSRHELDVLAGGVERVRAAYGRDIRVLFGGEADYLPGQEREVADLAEAYPFDYLLASVHFVGQWACDHPAEVAVFDTWDLRELYRTYFGLVAEAVGTGLFDIVAHVDLIKKFGHRPEGDWSGLVADVCRAASDAGMSLEINTAGFDKPVGEPYGSSAFLRACRDHGVGICFGSDAHAPEEVGRYFPQAVALAREAGHASYTWFERRRPVREPLPAAV